jgi:Lar family restriction alleviation protein
MSDLLACPFCGGEAKRHDIESREDIDNAGASYIECEGCGACTQLHFERKENLVSSWNDRISNHGGLDRQARNPAGLPDSSGDLALAGGIAGVDITDHRRQVGMPRDAFEWRAFYNASYPKLWGIETTDPAAIDAGLEIVVAPCMPEHAAKEIVLAWNEKTDEPRGALSSKEGLTP